MKQPIKIAALALSLGFAGVSVSFAGVALGVSVGSEGVNNFYLAVGNYYHVPQAEVISLRQSRLSDEELPVALFIAQRARVRHAAVVKLRLAGWSWFKIARHYRLASDAFYLGLSNPTGPYSRAHNYYRSHPRSQWGSFTLTDREIVNCVNLRFLSDHYGCRPDEVAGWRANGRRFLDIHEDLRVHRLGRHSRQDSNRDHDMDWGHPRNRGDHRERHNLDRDRDNDGRRDHGERNDHRGRDRDNDRH